MVPHILWRWKCVANENIAQSTIHHLIKFNYVGYSVRMCAYFYFLHFSFYSERKCLRFELFFIKKYFWNILWLRPLWLWACVFILLIILHLPNHLFTDADNINDHHFRYYCLHTLVPPSDTLILWNFYSIHKIWNPFECTYSLCALTDKWVNIHWIQLHLHTFNLIMIWKRRREIVTVLIVTMLTKLLERLIKFT